MEQDVSAAICEIRDLLRLIAEPNIAERDKKLRDELLGIVGKGVAKRKAVSVMDGRLTQTLICKKAGILKGNLSMLVKQLNQAKLLMGDLKTPKLAIPIPTNFFEQ